jgi:hypothetical protein
MIAPRFPGSVTPSIATRNGLRPLRPRISAAKSASSSEVAKAMMPCGASLFARASSFARPTDATATRLALASSRMSATASSSNSSDDSQISWILRVPAINSSRIAWRPSI